MILEPANDHACLTQLTRIARELAPTTLIQAVAERLGSRNAVIVWLQSLPQTNDDGAEIYRAIACDVPQRVRLLPDDPNCFERALAAMTLLEVVEPATMRRFASTEQPARHTGVVELRRGRWVALDVFPRRNFNWGKLGGDVLKGIQGAHHYVGKPVMQFYGLGPVSDLVEAQTAQLVAKKEKKDAPPARPVAGPAPAAVAAGGPAIAPLAVAAIGALAGLGGKGQPEQQKGGGNGAQEGTQRAPQAATAAPGGTAGRNRGPREEAETERPRWWGTGEGRE